MFARVGSSGSGQTTNATANTDFLLVANFSKDGSANYNRTDLFIDPPDFTEPGIADATAISAVTGLSSLSLFSVRNFNPEAGDTVFIDSLRLATTFADALGGAPIAVPEASTFTLLFASLLSLGFVGWRRRRR